MIFLETALWMKIWFGTTHPVQINLVRFRDLAVLQTAQLWSWSTYLHQLMFFFLWKWFSWKYNLWSSFSWWFDTSFGQHTKAVCMYVCMPFYVVHYHNNLMKAHHYHKSHQISNASLEKMNIIILVFKWETNKSMQ